MRFRFVHAADLHLDTPFEGIRGVAPEIASALRDASLEAFDALVDLCIEVDAAFLLVAGDVYDGAERGLRAQLRFRAGLERLSRNGVRAFVVHGNHDPVGRAGGEAYSAIRDWPDPTHVFGAEAVTGIPVVRAGERLATVYGISHARGDVRENLARRFPQRDEAEAGTGLRVGLLHCNAGAQPGHAPYAACSLDDLAAGAIDYWALGHVHTRQLLCEDPWVVYPGNLQGRTPHAGEQGPKGAVVVEVEAGRVVGPPQFRALDRVRFLAVDLDVSALRDVAEVERGLQREADALRADHPDRGLVLSVRLTGRSPVRGDLARPGATQAHLESLRDGRRDEKPFLWWSLLSNRVGSAIDRERLLEGDDFCAELLKLADELAGDADELARFAGAATEALPTELRSVRVPRPSADELPALLRQAEQRALDLLAGDERGGR